MRRINVFLGAAALVVPAVVSLTAAPAQAAGGTLKVYTLTRAGAQLNGPISVVQLSGGFNEQYTTSGKTLSLSPGRYAVMGDVWNSKDDTDTIGGQIVTVSASKAATTTIDARKGRPVKVALSSSPGTGYQQQIQTSVCAYEPDACMGMVGAYNDGGHIYAIPNASKQLRMAYMSIWNKNDGEDVYAARGYYVNGLPTSFGGTFSRANMTTVTAQVRRGGNYGQYQDLALQPQGTDPLSWLSQEVASGGPFTSRLHLSAGTWQVRSDDIASNGNDLGFFSQNLAAAPGRSYSPIFYRAAFGPARTLPYVSGGRARFNISDMFQDPAGRGFDASARATTTLSFGSRTIARSSQAEYGADNTDFSGKMTSTGWYTLYVDANRYYPPAARPAYMLSTAATLRFHFYANPRVESTVPGYLTQFVPAGLNMHSAAVPRSTTDVALWLSRPGNPNVRTPAETVRSVRTWASYDGGRTWHAVSVTHTGGKWAAHVVNPSSGAVSLRTTVTDVNSNSAETTVYRAYTVS